MKFNHENHRAAFKAYPVWDRTTRWFHWINALSILALATFGLAILYGSSFGVSSEGKILLKTLHVYVGYVFVTNLIWRLVWAFIGSPNARWAALLPFRRRFGAELKQYIRGFFSGAPPRYLGHDPLGRLMISLVLLLLTAQAASGLVLAGTDLYMPPFGGVMAEWVTGGDAEKLAGLQPGSKEFVDAAGYEEMRAFRKPFISTHLYLFYILSALIVLHIAGAVFAEIRHRNGTISAMFTGEKILAESPVDAEKDY